MSSARCGLLDWLEPLPSRLPHSRALPGPPPTPSWSRRERAARVSKPHERGKSRSGCARGLRGCGGEDAVLTFERGGKHWGHSARLWGAL